VASRCHDRVFLQISRRYPVIQCGRIDEDEHYYLDTQKNYGYTIELGNAGRIRPAERRYPA
jgi:methylmalonyl-CoA/ethylmalonyl-CoA epimerase